MDLAPASPIRPPSLQALFEAGKCKMKDLCPVGLGLFSVRQRQVQGVVVDLAEVSEELDGGRACSQRGAERLPSMEPEEAVPAPEQGELHLAPLEFEDRRAHRCILWKSSARRVRLVHRTEIFTSGPLIQATLRPRVAMPAAVPSGTWKSTR